MKPREYCCCAIPILNTGIYATLIEQMGLAVLVGILAVATPSVVGSATPSFAPLVLAIACFVAAAIQLVGFIGVSREKATLYRRYVTFHGIAISAVFSISAAWIIVSATRHDVAKSNCIVDYFSSPDGTSSAEGETLCEIFPWVNVGIMGALWVVLAAVHIYFFIVLSSYGRAQRRDHDQYDRVYDPSQPLTSENIPLDTRGDPWDATALDETYLDDPRQGPYSHTRKESAASASDIMNQPYQEPKDSLSNKDYSYSARPGATDEYKPAYPGYAHTADPSQTPTSQNYPDYSESQYPVEQPQRAQHHPAEGSFGRKTPRYDG